MKKIDPDKLQEAYEYLKDLSEYETNPERNEVALDYDSGVDDGEIMLARTILQILD